MDSLSFITDICGALKTIKRTGWVRHQIPLAESDADHMHRCAMCALLLTQPPDPRDDYTSSRSSQERFHPKHVDTNRLLRMALTHDVCEALAGDITPFCNPSLVASKHEKEQQALLAIQTVVGDPLGCELLDLWQEYEAQETVEAIYAKDIDKFEMVVQAYEYEKMHLQNRCDCIPPTGGAATPAPLAPDHDSTIHGENNNGETNNDILIPSVMVEPLRRFFISTNAVLQTPLFRRLDGELRQRREQMLIAKGWMVTDAERQQYHNDSADDDHHHKT
jgi:putative hydrolases of HD superfamily